MGLKRRASSKSVRSTESIEETTTFLNVDLDLEGPSDLGALVAALGPVFVLHQRAAQPSLASIEISSDQPLDVAETIAALLECIERLPPAARRLWNSCSKRSLNIGVQAGLAPHSLEYPLSNRLIERIAEVGGEVVVTVYGARVTAFV